jgi:hypothetical protein
MLRVPPVPLPHQPVFDTLVKNLEKARSHQIELASMMEFGVVIEDENASVDDRDKTLLPPTVGDTPVRPLLKPDRNLLTGPSSGADTHRDTDAKEPGIDASHMNISYMIAGTDLINQLNAASNKTTPVKSGPSTGIVLARGK